MNTIRIGTRGSQLALWQANWVKNLLSNDGVDSEIIVITTDGDQSQHDPIAAIGSQGVFTREIQQALLNHQVDLAIHSLKDLPTEPVRGLVLEAVPERGPFRDAFLSKTGIPMELLPEGATIGTGSIRRKSQILHLFGKRFEIKNIRGNIDTRLKKLEMGDYDAIILAEAGLVRLGLAERITTCLAPPDFLPAVGQGALGIEIRTDDSISREITRKINHPETFAAVTAERKLLQFLRGGCLAPVAAFASVEHARLKLTARVFSHDGGQMIETVEFGELDQPVMIGEKAAVKLVKLGAEKLLRV